MQPDGDVQMADLVNSAVSDPVSILLVEDDDGDAIAVRRAFSRAKIANPIRRAVDGVEALEILRAEPGPGEIRPNIVLLDINMPRMNGLETLREIRRDALLQKLVVVVLTTSDDPRDIEEAYDGNVAGYIVKQSAGSEFLRVMDSLDGFLKVIELPRS